MRIILICARMIYFMLTNISGEPNDYILEINEADVKNGDDSTENNVEVQELFEDDRN